MTARSKSVVERTFESVNTLFCQHVRGYTGANVTLRGAGVDAEAVWTIGELQELLDEWVIAGWQHRPHDSLHDPHAPGRALSPNEMFAALVARAGYLPVTLTGEDYPELLPACWRAITDSGVQLDYRTYDCAALNPYRQQRSGVDAKQGRWEVHYDPYDLSQVWVRDYHAGGWITVPWTHLGMVRQPFADFTWRHALSWSKTAAAMPPTRPPSPSRWLTCSGVPRQARRSPRRRRHRRASLTGGWPPAPAAAATTLRPHLHAVPASDPAGEGDDADDEPAEAPATRSVVPFGVFDPFTDGAEDYR